MSRTLANLAALLLAVVLSLLAAQGRRELIAPADDTLKKVVDAGGHVLTQAAYQRVISLTILSDPLLVEILEPERLVAGSTWTAGIESFKLGNRPRLRGPEEREAILALHPDLVIVSGVNSSAAANLRSAGIAVFELGDFTGWAHTRRSISDLGRLLREEERAARVLARADSRLAAVAARALVPRPRAVWVSAIGDRLLGGTVGSSYHDLLALAGCDDAAAGRYRGWPEYSLEDLFALDAELIVTSAGQGVALRRRSGADRLRARIIELPEAVAGDPGLGLVDAVEALRAALERNP